MGINSKDKYWQSVLVDFESSGVSQRQYCIDKELSLSKFKYYLKKQQKKDKSQQILSNQVPGFVPLVCKDASSETSEAASSVLSIAFPNKIRCELNISNASNEQLKSILSALVSL